MHEVQKSVHRWQRRFPWHARTHSKPLEAIQSDLYGEQYARAIDAITLTLDCFRNAPCGASTVTSSLFTFPDFSNYITLSINDTLLNSSFNNKFTDMVFKQKLKLTCGPITTRYLWSGESPPTRNEFGPVCCKRYSRACCTRRTRFLTDSMIAGSRAPGLGGRRADPFPGLDGRYNTTKCWKSRNYLMILLKTNLLSMWLSTQVWHNLYLFSNIQGVLWVWQTLGVIGHKKWNNFCWNWECDLCIQGS